MSGFEQDRPATGDQAPDVDVYYGYVPNADTIPTERQELTPEELAAAEIHAEELRRILDK